MTLACLRQAKAEDHAAALALQHAAFAPNAAIIGAEPLPLQADYAQVFATHEVWLAERGGALSGMMILFARIDDLYIWSLATAPAAQHGGIGNAMLDAAHERAWQLQRARLRLVTAEKLIDNVAWYQRRGFTIEEIATRQDRRIVHMVKELA